ncbi:MAG: enterochelin esterase [Rhodanobacter sp.]|nr:MAG: enterochelin esterase [Rhodanobacter sp.]TAM13623.1 MAG: enterochelin esterase [Rhodanobacter sp.]TAM35624.1 MAG: enterochelin esterase [Rhodanobacter sp.]
MRSSRPVVAALIGCGLLFSAGTFARDVAPVAPAHRFFHVQLGGAETQPVSGRLLLFATAARDAEAAARQHGNGKVEKVDANPFFPSQTAVAAREVSRLVPGQVVDIDADQTAFPQGWSQLTPGDYYVQVVLDVHHDYNYHGRHGGDLVSKVVKLHLPTAAIPGLTLTETLPERTAWDIPKRYMSETTLKHLDEARQHAHAIDFVSPVLSAFWGRPIHLRGWVLLPPGYDAKAGITYPTVYFTHGYGGDSDTLAGSAAMVYGATVEQQMPPMIWVFLDQSSPTGTTEFADSVNNGPWGTALTTELIPQLEKTYRMDARPSGRFLQGHSSGGWATLWLQTRYPRIFGGTWSTSPDPSDFHDFTGVDLYAPHANVFHQPDGTLYPLVRDRDKVLATFQQFAQLERVFGPYGGQLASFEWVFSPKGKDGRPQPMFNRDTGEVDPMVVAYWREHYDIAYRLRQHWPALKPDLDGKIHLYVGTADTFYLDGAAHRLKAVLDSLGAKSDIRFLPDRSHFDLYRIGDDRQGLLKQITWQMYAVARPHAALKPPVSH